MHIIAQKNSIDGHFEMGLGEEISITGLVRELKFNCPHEIIYVDNQYPELFFNNPYVNSGLIDSSYFIELKHVDFSMRFIHEYAKCLGIKIYNSNPEIFLTDDEINLYIQPKNTIVIDTWAGSDTRKWYHFEKLIDLLHNLNFRVVEIGKTLYNRYSNPNRTILSNVDDSYVDKLTIRETASVIKSSRLYIGNGSGLTHLSEAVSTNHITLFCNSCFNTERYRREYPMFNLNNQCELFPNYAAHEHINLNTCNKCSESLNSITPEDVINVINQNKL